MNAHPRTLLVLSMGIVALIAGFGPAAVALGAPVAACVFSPDGVVLHRPGGAPCGNDERAERVRVRARQSGAKTDFDSPGRIPPADPRVPVDARALAGSGPWLPSEPGTRALFRRTLARTLYAGPHLSARFHYRGDRIEEVFTAPSGFADARVEIRVTDRLVGERGLADISATQRHYVVPHPSHFEPVASEMAVRGKRTRVRQPEGSAPLVQGAKPGEPWDAGVAVIDGLAFERRAEVLGVQDVETPAGRFEKCLVVRYTGRLMRPGLSPLGDGVRVKSGRVVTTEWIARGVGRVQVREDGELRLGPVDDMPGRLTFEGLGQLAQLQRPAHARAAAGVPAAPAPQPATPWKDKRFKLDFDPALPLGTALPDDRVGFRADGRVEFVARGRRVALCEAEARPGPHDLLRLRCRDLESATEMRFDFVVSPDGRRLTSASGSQYLLE